MKINEQVSTNDTVFPAQFQMNQLNIVGHEESFRALDPILLTVFSLFLI